MQHSLFNEPTEILLSLADEYWQLILQGVKCYEYRRSFRRDRTRAFIVTTGPRAALVGYLELSEPIIDTPKAISRLAEQARPGNGRSVLEYMDGLQEAFAIPIESVYIGEPVGFHELRRAVPGISIPQSYFLVSRNLPLMSFVHVWMKECSQVAARRQS